MLLSDLFDPDLFAQRVADRYIRVQTHPTEPLCIANYAEKTAYEGVWDEVTRQCRGLIYHTDTLEVVARPFPKFFNHGQTGAPDLDMYAECVVTDKMDGSLGVIYPVSDGLAVATRGSFVSEQALHATEVLRTRYNGWDPPQGCTTLVEIVYPANRIVVDYQGMDDLVYLASLRIGDGMVEPWFWPGPQAETFAYDMLGEALSAPPRDNCEGLVVWFPETNERVKIKYSSYISLHRILTGTNARNVWEVAAVHACQHLIQDAKHWGSFLGIDAARAEEVMALGDDWLTDVPDEFYTWVDEVIAKCRADAQATVREGVRVGNDLVGISDRRTRWEQVQDSPLAKEILRYADDGDTDRMVLKAWRLATPEPTAPFARGEDVA